MPWANGYTYRRTVTIDHTKVSTADQSNFPVLIFGTFTFLKTTGNGGELSSSSGFDAIFTSDSAGATKLDWELVAYSPTTGAVEYHIRIPTVSHTVDTVFYIFTGNSSVTTDQSNKTGVWDSNYKAVYHFGDGTTLVLTDSTSHANNGTNHGVTATAGSLTAGAGNFVAASSQYIDLGNDASIELTGQCMLEAWISFTGTIHQPGVFPRVVSNFTGSNYNGFELAYNADANLDTHFIQYGNANTLHSSPNSGSSYAAQPLSSPAWAHIIGMYDGGTTSRIYVNGSTIGSDNVGSSPIGASSQNFNIGRWPGGLTFHWQGKIDEVRISNLARSSGWVITQYNNHHSPGTFTTFGSQTASGQTVTPTAIPTHSSWGSPTVAGPLTPSKIPTHASWPTPKVAGPLLPSKIPTHVSWPTPVLHMSKFPVLGIQTHVHWPTPVVAGPLTPALLGPKRAFPNPAVQLSTINVTPIPTHVSWPTPVVKLSQTIAISTTFGNLRTIPAPSIFHTQSIRPPSPIPTHASWPSPVVSSGPQFIAPIPFPRRSLTNYSAIQSNVSWPSPKVSGGVKSIHIWMNGVDVVQYLDISGSGGQFQLQSQTIGRWQSTFTLIDEKGAGAVKPIVGQTILITDSNGDRIMAGCLTDAKMSREMMSDCKRYACTATDKSGILDHRVVTGKTYQPTDQNGNPIAVSSVILDLLANYANGEGIIGTGVPTDGTLGNLTASLPFNFNKVSNAFDQLAALSGTVWWIDVDGILHFNPLTDLPAAPFGLTETSYNWRKIGVETTTVAYYNKMYAVSNLNVLPGSGSGGSGTGGQIGNVETFTWTVGDPGILSGIDPISGLPIATGIQVSQGIGSVVSMTVNGHAQTAYNLAQYTGQTSSGPNDYLWSFGPGDTTIRPASLAVPAAATIVINYIPGSSATSSFAQYGTALNPINPSGDHLGTCGSGIYEGVVQVKDISSQDELNKIAAADLDRIGAVPTIVTYQTDVPGLRLGQLQNINIPKADCPNLNLMITQLTGTYMRSEDLGYGGAFRWDVEARSDLDPGNWINWFERFIKRTENSLPILQYDEYTFVWGGGIAVASAVNATNPDMVGRTGLLIEVLVAWSVPPTDEDLVIQITRNNGIIASVVVPHTLAANTMQIFPVPKTNNLYLFRDDVLNISASFSVTGPNPQPPEAVTIKLRVAV